jgi:hypothetical protein
MDNDDRLLLLKGLADQANFRRLFEAMDVINPPLTREEFLWVSAAVRSRLETAHARHIAAMQSGCVGQDQVLPGSQVSKLA